MSAVLPGMFESTAPSTNDFLLTDRLVIGLLAVLMYSTALGARFDFPGLPVYAATSGLFLIFTVIRNLMEPATVLPRLRYTLPFLLLWTAVAIAYLRGGGVDLRTLVVFTINCSLGPAVVLYPWTVHALRWLAKCCIALALVLTYVTIVRFGSNEAIREVGVAEVAGYLDVTMMIGVGCLCAQYFAFSRMSAFRLALLCLLWVGVALGQGRGAFVSTTVAALVYTVIYLFGARRTATRLQKLAFIGVVALAAPVVWGVLNSIERNRNRFGSLFSDVGFALDDSGRSHLFSNAVDMISAAPVFGHGLGAYRMRGGHPHNLFLQYGVDAGYVAMILLSLFLLVVTVVGLRAILRSKEDERLLGLLFFALFFSIVVNMLKSYDAYEMRIFFVLSGLVLALGRVRVERMLASRRQDVRRRVARTVARTSSSGARHRGSRVSVGV